jgi:two-component system response regulator NreC
MPIELLIADDHQILRAGLRKLLEADPGLVVVGEATHGEEAVQLSNHLKPDVVLMDINMPGMNGLEAAKAIVQPGGKTHVLMLTMHEDVELLQACIRAGASGFIIKRAAESELIDAIHAVMRGIIYIHPSMMRSMMAGPEKAPRQPVSAGEPLTQREEETLKLIVQGYTNRQIASALNISVRTVETHRSNLMDKLNLHTRVDLVRYVNELNQAKLDGTA